MLHLSFLSAIFLSLNTHALQQPFDVTQIAEGFHVNRHHSLSTSAPIAHLLRQSDLLDDATDIYGVFHKFMDLIETRRTNNDTAACNMISNSWIVAAQRIIKVYQIGELSATCTSRLDLNDAVVRDELSGEYVRDAAETVKKSRDALFEVQKNWEGLPGTEDNWTRGAFALSGWELQRAGQKCSVDSMSAYTVKGKWYLRAAVTNNPVDAYVPDWNRVFVSEFIEEGFGDSLKMVHPKFKGEGLELSTTIMSQAGGRAPLASVSSMVMDENPAIAEALRLNELGVNQAEGAVTSSNIAILALPMLMSFLPVAFLADLNSCAMVWYMVFTDVFSAVPFLIKGIELLDTTKVKRNEMVTYFIGNETLGHMEIWAAECQGEDQFRTLGIVFVVIGIGAILTGIVLEVVAAGVMKKRRGQGKMDGPFGMAMFNTTVSAALERAGDEERDRVISEEIYEILLEEDE